MIYLYYKGSTLMVGVSKAVWTCIAFCEGQLANCHMVNMEEQ